MTSSPPSGHAYSLLPTPSPRTPSIAGSIAGYLVAHFGFRQGPPPGAERLAEGAAWVGTLYASGQPVGLEIVVVVERGAFTRPSAELLALGPVLAPFAGRTSLGLAEAHARVTVVEIGEGPLAPADLDRLASLHVEGTGPLLVSALWVDALSGRVVSASPALSGVTSALLSAASPRAWIDGAMAAHAAASAMGGGFAATYAAQPAMFSPRAIGVASVLFSPVAGLLMLAWNYEAIRRRRVALGIVFGTLAGFALLAVFFMHGPSIPTGLLGHLLVAASLVGVAKKRFGDPLRKVPVWGSFAAVGATAVMLLSTGIAMAMIVPAPHVAAAGSGKHVDYTWGERAAADRAATILTDTGVFADDRVLDATIERERKKLTVSLRTSSEAWSDAALVGKAQDAADAIATREGGEVSVELRSEFGIEQKTLVGRKEPAFR